MEPVSTDSIPAIYQGDEELYLRDKHCYSYLALWHILFVLVEVPGFRNELNWYAAKLTDELLDYDQIQQALEGLTRLGLIQKNKLGQFTPLVGINYTNNRNPVERLHHVRGFIQKADPFLDKVTYGYIRADRKIINKYYPKLQEIIDEMIREGEETESTEVVGVSFGLVQVTKET